MCCLLALNATMPHETPVFIIISCLHQCLPHKSHILSQSKINSVVVSQLWSIAYSEDDNWCFIIPPPVTRVQMPGDNQDAHRILFKFNGSLIQPVVKQIVGFYRLFVCILGHIVEVQLESRTYQPVIRWMAVCFKLRRIVRNLRPWYSV